MNNALSKKILEANEVSTITPVRSKLLLIPEHIAKQYQVVPFDGEQMTVAVLTTNTFSEALQSIYGGLQKAGYTPDIYYTDEAGIQIALGWYTQAQQEEQRVAQQQKQQQEAVGVNALAQIMELYPKRTSMDPGEFLLQVIKYGFQAGASDLHLQVQEQYIVLRLRIDGVMKEVCQFEPNEYMAYLQKIKFLGGMKMNIDYVPQDGRLAFEVDLANDVHKKIDVRINTMPGLNGLENVVMRYLDSHLSITTFEQIGFWGKGYQQLQSALQKHEGMILVTGPTGS